MSGGALQEAQSLIMKAEPLTPPDAETEIRSDSGTDAEAGPASTVRALKVQAIGQDALVRWSPPPERALWDVDASRGPTPPALSTPAAEIFTRAGTHAPSGVNAGVFQVARDFAAGKILADKYRIERKLGEGAMGFVLQATHLGLDEAVAIKLMRPEVQSMEGALARFAKEAKIAARIRSEHVAKVLDVGQLEHYGPYIVMEYLEGSSLAELLDARLLDGRGPLAADRVIEYVLQACEALAAAHAIGVTHRDVKPDNLFVTRHGGLETLKLLDFGISKAALTGFALGGAAPTSTVSFVMGTPLYMSPEQLRSSPDIDARTDVWSIGAVMFELLCGAPPFDGASIPEICAAILDAPPGELPASVSAPLRAIVLRCLEKEPDQRFQTVAELAAALVPLAPGEAKAYASRASCILRASSLNLNVEVDLAQTSSRSAKVAPARSVRFQSSALVAAATVLALSALGVASTLSSVPAPPSPPHAPARLSAAPLVMDLSPPLEPGPALSTVRIAPVLASEPGSSPTPERAAPRKARAGSAAPGSRARRLPLPAAAASSSRGEPSIDGERVRLVAPRAKLRLVERDARPRSSDPK